MGRQVCVLSNGAQGTMGRYNDDVCVCDTQKNTYNHHRTITHIYTHETNKNANNTPKHKQTNKENSQENTPVPQLYTFWKAPTWHHKGERSFHPRNKEKLFIRGHRYPRVHAGNGEGSDGARGDLAGGGQCVFVCLRKCVFVCVCVEYMEGVQGMHVGCVYMHRQYTCMQALMQAQRYVHALA